jgi:hypothetical protein
MSRTCNWSFSLDVNVDLPRNFIFNVNEVQKLQYYSYKATVLNNINETIKIEGHIQTIEPYTKNQILLMFNNSFEPLVEKILQSEVTSFVEEYNKLEDLGWFASEGSFLIKRPRAIKVKNVNETKASNKRQKIDVSFLVKNNDLEDRLVSDNIDETLNLIAITDDDCDLISEKFDPDTQIVAISGVHLSVVGCKKLVNVFELIEKLYLTNCTIDKEGWDVLFNSIKNVSYLFLSNIHINAATTANYVAHARRLKTLTLVNPSMSSLDQIFSGVALNFNIDSVIINSNCVEVTDKIKFLKSNASRVKVELNSLPIFI